MNISVVIPAYNEEKYIGIALNSLSKQSYKNFEVIVCLNACTDNTYSLAEKIAKERNLNLKIINEERKGVAWARNTGFKKATGDIIASADADTYYPKDWLAKINYNFSHESIVAVYGPVYMKSKKWSLRFSAKYLFSFFLQASHLIGNYNLNGMNFAVKKSAFNKIGGFNTDWQSAEDIYIGIKLKNVGKVKYDRRLITYTSDRRFYGKALNSLMHHVKNYIDVFIFKKYPSSFKDIR